MFKKLFFIILCVCVTHPVYAAMSLIRDAQTERFLRQLSNPIFEAAKLNAKDISIYIINDNSLNAFVTGGQNVFIHTGLIRKYNTPDALIGVIAHEAGHIAGGHLARSSEAMEKSSNAMILSYLLGIGAAVAGSPEAGQAIILGGSNTAQRLYLKYNRGQEEAADQYAIAYLDELQYPADGLLQLLEFFEMQMIGYKDEIDEYFLSHPISKKRIDLIKERTKGKQLSDVKINQKLQPDMDVVLAKLEGFMDDPDQILKTYRYQTNPLSYYKRAIAYFRTGKINDGLYIINKLIDHEENAIRKGFLYELKGQFLFESGMIQESVVAYNNALALLPDRDAAQSKIAISSAILSIAGNDSDLTDLAINYLDNAKKYESQNPFLFRQLAIAYDKVQQTGKSYLALAQYYYLSADKEKALKYAKKAKENLSNKQALLEASDLIEIITIDEKKEGLKR